MNLHKSARWWRWAITGTTVLALATGAVPPTLASPAGSTGAAPALAAPAVTLGLSTFEIDGDLVSNHGGLDWASPARNLNSDPDKASGQLDDALGQGAKEDVAMPSVVAGSIPNNKSDLTRFYVANDKAGSYDNGTSNDFLYLAWERANTLG